MHWQIRHVAGQPCKDMASSTMEVQPLIAANIRPWRPDYMHTQPPLIIDLFYWLYCCFSLTIAILKLFRCYGKEPTRVVVSQVQVVVAFISLVRVELTSTRRWAIARGGWQKSSIGGNCELRVLWHDFYAALSVSGKRYFGDRPFRDYESPK